MAEAMDWETEVEEALRGLADVDGLVDEATDKELVGKYLNSSENLKQMLCKKDSELRDLQEQFIEEHCAQADNLCALYNEVSECEAKLFSFEEQIFSFQKTLTDTAEDIVRMQQQTVELVHRVANRKQVSNKINEVYNALKECEEFCDSIASKEVDKEYLANIRELESKIAFLANNKELENSAVDQEIRPKLRVAAQRAGDKLHRYLSKKIFRLAEEGTNIGLQQQALETVGQYAYSFLDRYNKPVATELQQAYTTTMMEVHLKQIRNAVRELTEFRPYVNSSEPLLASKLIELVVANKDIGAGGESVREAPRRVIVHKREKSVSVQVKEFADKMAGKQSADEGAAPKRVATLDDTVGAIKAVDFEYTTLHLDPKSMWALNETTSWLWRFVKFFTAIVNMTILESKFISSFFFAHGQNLDAEENLTKHVLSRAITAAHAALIQELPAVRDRVSAIGALRVVDQMKFFFCRCTNPIPLMLLSGIFEVAASSLRGFLHKTLAADTECFANIAAVQGKLKPLSLAPNVTLTQLAPTLGPHDITVRFATVVGTMHLLNTMELPNSRVDRVTVQSCDETMSAVLRSQLTSLVELLQAMARRHSNAAAQKAFLIQNLGYLIAAWNALAFQFMTPDDSSTPVVPLPFRMFSESESSANDKSAQSVAPSAHVADLECHLRNEIAQFIIHHSRSNECVAQVFQFTQEAESQLGSAFFVDSDDTRQVPAVVPSALQEASVLPILTNFSLNWKKALQDTASAMRSLFICHVPPPSASELDWPSASAALTNLVMREYFQTIIDANQRVNVIVKVFYPKHSTMQSKLVGRVGIVHEVGTCLSDDS